MGLVFGKPLVLEDRDRWSGSDDRGRGGGGESTQRFFDRTDIWGDGESTSPFAIVSP